MYFESQEVAEKFTATIAGTLIEMAAADPNPLSTASRHRQQSSNSDVVNVEFYNTFTTSAQINPSTTTTTSISTSTTELTTTSSPNLVITTDDQSPPHQQQQQQLGVGKAPGTARKQNRRKSLADFQEINDAVGSALDEADQSLDNSEANFNKAVGEQVRGLRDSALILFLIPLSLPPSPSPSVSQIVILNDKPRKSFSHDPNTENEEDDLMPTVRPISFSLPPPPSPSATCRLPDTRVRHPPPLN
jgi:hypothetical protein